MSRKRRKFAFGKNKKLMLVRNVAFDEFSGNKIDENAFKLIVIDRRADTMENGYDTGDVQVSSDFGDLTMWDDAVIVRKVEGSDFMEKDAE